ncbi:MAG: SMI1/KNR4 family protein [Lachnospiraceae bacterium]|nr:SMI1/KNR4 family protein [Lachnospiraceae bacterium]
MGKADQASWIRQIYKRLEQAKAKDDGQEVFGADSHKYRLAPPAGEEAIQVFELKYGIRLPEEYRNFLMLVGDGGAGPYYGIYGLRALEQALKDDQDYSLLSEPALYPKMSDEDWDIAVKGQPFAGILPIGSQGCSHMTGLMLRGPYCGQVVYFDLDHCVKPFFVRENGFLAWYMRWLHEVISGYEIFWFGTNLDGNEQQLMEQYQQADNSEEKAEIIDSFRKFKKLPKKQQQFFKAACDQEPNMEIRMKLVKMLAHFRVKGMGGQIEKMWEYGAYAEAISVINYEGDWDTKKKWQEQILEKLPQLRGDAFRDACYTIKALKDCPDINAGRLKEALAQKDLDKNEKTVLFYCIRALSGKEAVVDYFLDFLLTEQDPYLLIYAIQALEGIADRRLQNIYVKLLDRYRIHENAQKDYQGSQKVLAGGGCLGASRPEGQVVSNLMRRFDLFGLDYRGAWKLLMNDQSWEEWKRQRGFEKLWSSDKRE